MCNKNSQCWERWYDWRNERSVVGIAGLENETRPDRFCDMQQKRTPSFYIIARDAVKDWLIRSCSFMSYGSRAMHRSNYFRPFSSCSTSLSLFYPHWIKVRKLSPFPSRALLSLQTVKELVVKMQRNVEWKGVLVLCSFKLSTCYSHHKYAYPWPPVY
jgi:hypothetical protein